MEVLKIQKDYGWILKVLDSCTNKEQVKTCENLYKNFINKWSDELSEERLTTFFWNFQKQVSQKNLQIKKVSSCRS